MAILRQRTLEKLVADQLGTTTLGTSGVLLPELGPHLTATRYGAVADGDRTDGQTPADNTAAIQAAIDAAYSSGAKTVYLPPGTYAYSGRIIIKGTIRLEGPGYRAGTPATLKATAADACVLMPYQGSELRGLTFNLNSIATTGVWSISHFHRIDDCHFLGGLNGAVGLKFGGSLYPIVDRCLFNAMGNTTTGAAECIRALESDCPFDYVWWTGASGAVDLAHLVGSTSGATATICTDTLGSSPWRVIDRSGYFVPGETLTSAEGTTAEALGFLPQYQYGTDSGTFTVGETVTGGTSGATAVVDAWVASAYLRIKTVVGTFVQGELITGSSSGATTHVCATLEFSGRVYPETWATGELFTGGTSGATGYIMNSVGGAHDAAGLVTLKQTTGTFVVGETITGGTYGATLVVTRADGPLANYTWLENSVYGLGYGVNTGQIEHCSFSGTYGRATIRYEGNLTIRDCDFECGLRDATTQGGVVECGFEDSVGHLYAHNNYFELQYAGTNKQVPIAVYVRGAGFVRVTENMMAGHSSSEVGSCALYQSSSQYEAVFRDNFVFRFESQVSSGTGSYIAPSAGACGVYGPNYCGDAAALELSNITKRGYVAGSDGAIGFAMSAGQGAAVLGQLSSGAVLNSPYYTQHPDMQDMTVHLGYGNLHVFTGFYGSVLNYDGATANFVAGTTVTGLSSGHTATIRNKDNDAGTTGSLIVTGATGTFTDDEALQVGGVTIAYANGTLGVPTLTGWTGGVPGSVHIIHLLPVSGYTANLTLTYGTTAGLFDMPEAANAVMLPGERRAFSVGYDGVLRQLWRAVPTLVSLPAGDAQGISYSNLDGAALNVVGATTLATLTSGANTGTAGSGSTTTSLVKPTAAANWTASDLVGRFLRLTGGGGAGGDPTNAPVFRVIKANTTTTATVDAVSGMDATTTFQIVELDSQVGAYSLSDTTCIRLANNSAPLTFRGVGFVAAGTIAELVHSSGNRSVTFDGCRFGRTTTNVAVQSLRDDRFVLSNCLFVSGADASVSYTSTSVEVSNCYCSAAGQLAISNSAAVSVTKHNSTGALSAALSLINVRWASVECKADSGAATPIYLESVGSFDAVGSLLLTGSSNTGYGVEIAKTGRYTLTGSDITGSAGDVLFMGNAVTWTTLSGSTYGAVEELSGNAVANSSYAKAQIYGNRLYHGSVDMSGRLLLYGYLNQGSPNTPLTATGSARADALDLSGVPALGFAHFGTVAAGTGCRLPSGALIAGVMVTVHNGGANDLLVYPPGTGSETIDGGASVTVTSGHVKGFMSMHSNGGRDYITIFSV